MDAEIDSTLDTMWALKIIGKHGVLGMAVERKFLVNTTKWLRERGHL